MGGQMKRLTLIAFVLAVVWSRAASSRLLAGSTSSTRRIQPRDLVYRGAFRLPDGPDEIAWAWSGEAMTYYPGGDPGGGADGYPGSIFGVGHNWNQHVSEVTIPKPVVSAAKNLRDLNTAKTLQPFANIRGDLFGEMEQARCGLAYLPRQGAQRKDKLYFCWAPHLDEGSRGPSHGWCELSLANPAPAGPWSVGGLTNYMTADYIFAMPKAWADKKTPGMLLAT